MEKQIAISSGINWNWYLEFQFVDENQIKILRHFRIHKEDGELKFNGQFKIIEDSNRIAQKVDLIGHSNITVNWHKEFIVVNPQHVFSYKE